MCALLIKRMNECIKELIVEEVITIKNPGFQAGLEVGKKKCRYAPFSLLSLPSPHPFLPLPFPVLSSPLPLEVGQLNSARGMGALSAPPAGYGAEPGRKRIFGIFWRPGNESNATILMIFLTIN